MKKLFNYSIALLVGSMAIFSCRQRDVVAPTVVQQSNTPNGTRSYTLAVLVRTPQIKGVSARVEALEKATVTISQGTSTQVVTTGADGIANFSGLNEGEVVIAVAADPSAATKYAKISRTVSVSLSSLKDNQSNQVGVISEIIDLPELSGSVSGRIVGNFTFASGIASAGDATMEVRLDYGPDFEPNFYVVSTTGAGVFNFTGVPAAPATITGRVVKPNGSDDVTFQIPLQTIALDAQRLLDLGTIEAKPLNAVNSSTIKGTLYGDFAGILTVNGIAQLDANGIPLVPAPNQTNYNALNSVSGTVLGFSSTFLKSDVIVEAVFSGLPSGAQTTYATKTDANGNYTLSNLPSGKNYTLTAKVQVTPTSAPTTGPDAGIIVIKTFTYSTSGTTTANFITDLGADKMTE